MRILPIEQYLSVVRECKNGKTSQKKAQEELGKIHDVAINKNRETMMEIMGKSRFFEDIRYSKEELINVYDKSMNSTSELERNEYEQRFKVKIEDIIFEATSRLQPDDYKEITGRDFELFRDSIYQERNEIARLCQENRKTTEDYLKCRVEIGSLENLTSKQSEQQGNSDYEKNIFIQILKKDSPKTYKAMKKAIESELVEYTDKYFNFRCSKGSVGLFFGKTECKDRKLICQYVLINNDPCELVTLGNWKKNTKPEDWERIEKVIFATALR